MSNDILHTSLCALFDIKYPVLLAGMGTVAGPTLAAAVTNAGGLGVMGLSGYLPEEIDASIRKCQSLTSGPFGVDLLIPSGTAQSATEDELWQQIPLGHKDFVEDLKRRFSIPEPTWERTPKRPALTVEYYRKQMEVVLDHRVPLFVSALGNPAWMTEDAHKAGTQVMGLVGNVRNARRVSEGGADIIGAQGYDAGGHTGRIGTLSLVPQVIDAVRPKPVVAAGGIGDGRQIAACLVMGAVGVWMGTRFIATPEAGVDALEQGRYYPWYLEYWKQRIVDAQDEDTSVSRVNSGKTARGLRNAWKDAWEQLGAPQPLPMPLQGLLVRDAQQGAMEGEVRDAATMAAGQSVGIIHDIKPTAEVMAALVEQAREALEGALPLLPVERWR